MLPKSIPVITDGRLCHGRALRYLKLLKLVEKLGAEARPANDDNHTLNATQDRVQPRKSEYRNSE
jgi:hypothetical protein